MQQKNKETGNITYWNEKKKYGFIRPENSAQDLFFHISNWQSPNPPQKSQTVSFHRGHDQKERPIAIKVQAHTAETKKKARLFNILILSAVLLIGSYFSFDVFYKKTTPNNQQTIHQTIERIQNNGPFAYPEYDGKIFYNHEKKLPERPTGYYREYTIAPEGAKDRGEKRIVTGGDPIEILYYTEDHYQTFIKLEDYP